ncbi:chemokine-like factor [Cheilinus undulatus]|uniref:chemokine-like factor n=1 Tax=Cheilinus undulatus TaxID=241271 RepID=UPI001BD63BEE|nr:chemokine-like factor [Cheilinus undulatus]
MSEDQNTKTSMEVDIAFLKSKRGILKAAEMGTLFVAFVCFSVVSAPGFITATVLEFLITLFLLLLYMLKFNKRLTFFFWPLVDVINSVFAALFFIVLSPLALTTYTATGTLVGGIVGLLTVGLLCADGYTLFRKITFNNPRREAPRQDKE